MEAGTISETEEGRRIREAREADEAQMAEGGEGDAGAGDFPGEGGGDGDQGGEPQAGAAAPDPDGSTDDADPPPAIPKLEIAGEGQQLTLTVGGEAPTEGVVKFKGGSVALPDKAGQFKKGSMVNLAVTARVKEVHFVDKVDKQSGQVIGTIRRHILEFEHVERV